MGTGMALLLISGLYTQSMGVANHDCTSEEEICQITIYFVISPHFLIIKFCLNAVGYNYATLHRYLRVHLCPEPSLNERTPYRNSFCHDFQLFGVLLMYTPIF